MLTNEKIKEIKTESMYSAFHYMITVIFFIVVLINTIYLTKSIMGMSVDSSDENTVKAKNLMISACTISYIGDFLIALLVGFSYWYGSNSSTIKNLMNTTGVDDIYVGIRIAIFSILMIVSLLVGSICISASKEIQKSSNESEYNSEKNLCKDIGQMFILHFMIFTLIQGGVTIWKLFYDSGNIKTLPKIV